MKTRLDRLLDRIAQPALVLRAAALSMCLLELGAAVASLLGFRTDAYDGAVAAVWLRLGGASNDAGLLIVCFSLVLLFARAYWQLARDGSADQPVPQALGRILLIDLLAVCVTPGLPFLVTALAGDLWKQATAQQQLISGPWRNYADALLSRASETRNFAPSSSRARRGKRNPGRRN